MTTVAFLFWGLLGLSRGAGKLPKNSETKL
jgi:hypothetical protein